MTLRSQFSAVIQDLRPYPGRDWQVVRIVVAVLLSAIFVLAFGIPNGWLSLYLCFVFAKSTTKQTILMTTAVLIASVPVILFALCLLKLVVEPAWLRLLALTLFIYGTFFLSKIMTEGDIVRNMAIIFVTAFTFPDVYSSPSTWIEGTMWLVPMILAGILPLILVTLIIPPERVLPVNFRPPPVKYAIVKDAWTNPEHLSYALKGTCAAMGAYLIYSTLNFQAIQTALMTCLILGLPTTEQIIHKSWMRITGACIGAALALIAAIWIIPLSSSIWLLLVVVGVGSSIAAWVSLSSPRIYYAGRQIALAQFMLISHSFGPSTDLSVLTDRLLGIILGNIMMALSYKYLWPTKLLRGSTLQKAVPILLVGAACFIATGCTTSSKELAPSSPNQTWTGSGSAGYGLPAQYEIGTHAVELDPDHEYSLSELADLAQRNNPSTRVAWEQARAAAGGIGVAESAYYPQLNLMVSAGYEHVAFPLPTNVFEQGYFYSQIAVLEPELQLDWILWDFGRQQAAVRGAKESAISQNFSFNQEHQQVLFDVCSAYYKLINIRSQQSVMEAALKEAEIVGESTQSALEQGFATQAELLQAQQFVLQCTYEVTVLRGERRKAEIALAESVGANPGQVLKIKSLTDTTLPDNIDESVESLVNYALSNRPDLQAMVADLRAAEANVDQVEAQRGPTLVATGNVGPGYSAFKADDMSWVDSHDLLYGVGLGLQFPIFDGFRRKSMLRSAIAEKRATEASLVEARNDTIRQVWDAYTDFENAHSRMSSASALVRASEASMEATLASFEQGFSDVTDVQAQQVSLTEARESYNQSRTDFFLSASLLQFATGQISLEQLD